MDEQKEKIINIVKNTKDDTMIKRIWAFISGYLNNPTNKDKP